MKYLYKYPQAAFPYQNLVETSRGRSRNEFEYELLDTGIFNDNRYFDVFVEYAKESPDDILIQISVANRGPEASTLHVLPMLWFRNTWSWSEGAEKPRLQAADGEAGVSVVEGFERELGERFLYCEGKPTLLFTENETNTERVFGQPGQTQYAKDGINDYVVHGRKEAVNPGQKGTKASADYKVNIGPGETKVIRLRLTSMGLKFPSKSRGGQSQGILGEQFDESMAARRKEADDFYASITPPGTTQDAARVMRQALAGMLWSKQYYQYDLHQWLKEHGEAPFAPSNRQIRNKEWFHMINDDIISMPDKWEYPWYAAW